MAKPEMTVLTNMCMIRRGEQILVLDRMDPDWPGITFPGGHVEPGESFVRSAAREVFEETGLRVSGLRLCGVQQFTRRDGAYRYVVLFFKTDTFEGELTSSGEGRVFWIDRKDLETYTLADGFGAMLEVFERDDLSENYFYFDNDWTYENL